MNTNLKILLIGLIPLVLICCSSSPPPKDEIQEVRDESDRRIEQQFEAFENAMVNLRKECSVLKEDKTFLNDNWQKYKQDEADFLIQLNERQLEFYSGWYDSLKGDNQPKMLLYTKKLANSLDETQKALLRNLYMKRLEHNKWVSDFQKRSNDFENKKNVLLNYVRLLGGDSQSNEIFILLIEKELTY
jgi:hypothetical protein